MKIFALKSALLLLAGFMAWGPSAQAATINEPVYTSQFLTLNKIPPLKNTKYIPITQMLGKRMMDSNMKGVGEVEDIAFWPVNGKLDYITTKIDTVGFRETVDLNIAQYNINYLTNLYTIDMTGKQIEQNIAGIMANIESASGDGIEQPVSAKQMLQSNVIADGKKIGRVENVLIDNREKAVAALVIALVSGSGAPDAVVALPYNPDNFVQDGVSTTVQLSKEEAAIISNYGRKR